MKQQMIIITITFCALVGAMIFLAFVEEYQVASGDDFWSVYFVRPLENSDNSFIIDNHGPKRMFTYTITTHDTTLTDTAMIPADEWHHVTLPDHYNNLSPITIEIDNTETKKSIYKQ